MECVRNETLRLARSLDRPCRPGARPGVPALAVLRASPCCPRSRDLGAVLMPPDHTPYSRYYERLLGVLTHSRYYERLLGVLIWCAFAAVGIAALYGCSLIMGD